MPIPEFENNGDLPEGLHPATFDEVLAHFGTGSLQRESVTKILTHVYSVVLATGHLERFIIYGSYITAKSNPHDVDIFLVMAEAFEFDKLVGDAKLIFSHGEAQPRLGASIFWVTRGTSLANIDFLMAGWQTKRDKTLRGIIEVVL